MQPCGDWSVRVRLNLRLFEYKMQSYCGFNLCVDFSVFLLFAPATVGNFGVYVTYLLNLTVDIQQK